MKKGLFKPKPLAVGISILVYVFAIIIVFFADAQFGHFHVLGQIAIADLTGTITIFFFSLLFNNSSIYDPYWSVKPAVIAIFYFASIPFENIVLFHIVFLFLIISYSVRLTINFYTGWKDLKHEDWRYSDFRKNYPQIYWLISLFGLHIFPSIMVYLGCLPMFALFKQPIVFPSLAIVGSILLFGSVLLAYRADLQLRKFRLLPDNHGKTIKTGLWGRSRHPNYLGEILTWWSLFIMALGCGWQYWWTGIGAMTITAMFYFISIPLIEKHALKRRSDYAEYQRQVPMLLPFFRK